MTSIIPDNINGKALDIEHTVEENSIGNAIKTFERARTRLINPQVWHLLTGALSAKFSLDGSNDTDNRRLAKVDDYFSIDIPGPGLISGDGFDWVKVELLEENSESDCDTSIAMRLRATNNPKKTDEGIAHFFNAEATSTFIIKRIGKMVSASYHGRNETVNTDVNSLVDKIRNQFVATGSKAGLSKLQWDGLIKSFLEADISG